MPAFRSGPLGMLVLLLALGACGVATAPSEEVVGGVPLSQVVPGYGLLEDSGYTLPPVPPAYLRGVNRRAVVAYRGDAAPGTIEIDPHAKFLYWIEADGTAIRYPIAVGREGRGITSGTVVRREEVWPGWTPTANMLRREPEVYGPYRGGVPGGLTSPLGARALYLYRGGRDTFYRIHGTNDLGSIGNSGSAGCIRLFNQDIIDLYDRVPLGTDVVIRSYEDSVRIEGPLMANRGVELPPFVLSPDELTDGVSEQRPPADQAMVPEVYYGNPAGQVGVTYVPDPSDPYPTEAGAEAVVLAAAPGASPLAAPAAPSDPGLVGAGAGVEMLGTGFVVVDGGPVLP